MRSVIQLADNERRAGILPADSAGIELKQPTLFLWTVLAGLSLILALVWRFTGIAPPLPAVLNASSLAFWLTAPWLATAWDQLLRRQRRHVQFRRDPWSWRLANASYLLMVALVISTAPMALLLGFRFLEPIADIYLQDPYTIYLPVGIWLIASLLLVGPVIVIFSTVLLHVAHVILGWRWGLASWLILAFAFNAPIAVGSGPLQLSWPWPVRLHYTVGQYASWVATEVASTRASSYYLHELIGHLAATPIYVLLAVLILATVFQEPARRLATRLNPLWLAALASIITVAGRAAWQGWLWSNQPSHTYPGDWVNLFYTGLATACLVWGVLLLRGETGCQPAWRVLGWLLFTAGGWSCLTLVHRIAGHLTLDKLLFSGCTAALTVVALVALMYRTARAKWLNQEWIRQAALVLIMGGLLLPLPLADQNVPPVYWAFSRIVGSLSSEQANGAGPYYLLALLLFCGLIWPFSRGARPQARQAQSKASS